MNKIQKSILLANIVSISLVFIKLITGILTGSLAVLSSALDSLLDFFVSLFNLYVFKKSNYKEDEEYNYGHGKIQGIGAVIEGIIVGLSGIGLIYFAFEKIIKNTGVLDIDISIYMMIVSIIITGALVFYLYRTSKETNNLTLKADLLHYKTDLFTNSGIIFSLILIKITGLQIIDSLISIIIGVYILHSSKDIIFEGYEMLMDKSISSEIIEKIKNIIEKADKRITGYHALKTRKSGDQIFVDFHLVFNKEIKLIDAHTISDKIEIAIGKEVKNSTIMIHLDPYDDSSKDYIK